MLEHHGGQEVEEKMAEVVDFWIFLFYSVHALSLLDSATHIQCGSLPFS
jgi:hypothetical protein